MEPGETPSSSVERGYLANGGAKEASPEKKDEESSNAETTVQRKRRNRRMPTGNEYGPDRPRRSTRTKKPRFT